jgi:hypothetical protein
VTDIQRIPRRDDPVGAWLKAQRDALPEQSIACQIYGGYEQAQAEVAWR